MRRKKKRRRRRTALVVLLPFFLLKVAEVGLAEAGEAAAEGLAAGFPTRARRGRTEALVAGRAEERGLGDEGEPLRISGGERLKT